MCELWLFAEQQEATNKKKKKKKDCVDECCVGSGERPANRPIGKGKIRNLSAPQGAHLYNKPTGNRSREGSSP